MRLPLSCLLLDLLAVHSSAHPEALPEAIPEAIPEALPEALAEADPQTYTNNAPFSGAIYIVNPNGQAVTAEGTNVCPVSASVSCSTIGQPSW
jgi:hypothetical protein